MSQGLSKTEQKRAVAVMLMQAAGNILEFWSERDDVEDIDPDMARRYAEVSGDWSDHHFHVEFYPPNRSRDKLK